MVRFCLSLFVLLVVLLQYPCLSKEKTEETYFNFPDRIEYTPISITCDGTNLIVIFKRNSFHEDLIVFYDKKTLKAGKRHHGFASEG